MRAMYEQPDTWEMGMRALEERARPQDDVEPLTEYQGRPMDFMLEVLGERRETYYWSENAAYDTHQWDGDVDPFVQASELIGDFESVALPGGIGIGKTRYLAGLVLYHVGCFKNSITATCAPRKEQLLRRVWKEIRVLWPAFQDRFPSARLMDSGEIRMLEGNSLEWCAYADVAGVRSGEVSATRVQGEHAKHLLIITEETPGIHPSHMVAFKATCTGPYNIQVSVGNPDYSGDQLAQFATRPDVTKVRISALDHPNVVMDDADFVPGAATREWCEMRYLEWFKRMPHMYESRVRGLFPGIAIGAVYEYDPEKHTSAWTRAYIERLARTGDVRILVGIDTGSWRFTMLLAALDSADRLHVFKEFWSSQETTDVRMRRLIDYLEEIGCAPEDVRIWHDPGGGVDTTDLRAAMKRQGWTGRLPQQGSKAMVKGADNKKVRYRRASYQRIMDLMSRGQLLFAADLEEDDLGWEIGASTKQRGKPMDGSRLIWEIKNLRWEDPADGRTQRDDPDEASADGADMIAALRFIAMQVTPKHAPLTQAETEELDQRAAELDASLARPAPFHRRNLPPQRVGNRDFGLERITALHKQHQLQAHPQGGKLLRKHRKKRKAERRRAKERERIERARLIDEMAERQKLRDAARDVAGALDAAIDRLGGDEEEAIDRILGLTE
ncbi:MAG: hypothetical protein ACODAA_00880 [Gemmatimonadota bacterium]